MKRSIYIVDDQPQVLETALAIVAAVMPEAAITGFDNPFKALEAIKASPPDLILTDHLMPGMHGNQLLEEARAAAPDALRIIMSGFVALDKLNVITSAHQYVAKPFDALQLKEMLRRAFGARGRVRDEGLQRVVTSLRSLPSLPQARQTLLAELESGQGASGSIGQMVAQDAGLSAKVLQLANSPLFGRDYLVANPVEAVLCLGTDMIAAVALSQTLFKQYQSNAHREFSPARVWNHCWETAALAQGFCGEQGLARAAREEAFLAGLLHETGRLILVDNFPEQFQAACDAARRDNSPLAPRLAETLGAPPSRVAAYLLDLWGLPESVVAAVGLLHHPEEEQAAEFTIASALYIADQVSSRETPPDLFAPAEWNAAYLRSIGCPDELKAWTRTEAVQ
jgi:HD-like signal output (HDOD) protein